MTRVIKFRAWNTKLKVMVDDWAQLGKDGVYAPSASANDVIARGDEYAVMQFTGLHDKHGMEIYEGDLVEFSRANIDYKMCPIRYSDALAAFVLDVKDALFLLSDGVNLEVIGNIYENGELLNPTEE